MGLDDHWTGAGGTTHRATAGNMGEGDSSGRPGFQQPGSESWPTLVIESGYSQSLQALRNDMRWWFSALNPQVKIAIIAKLDATERSIILEKYQEVQAAQQTGATMTRAAGRLEPRLDQTIHITQATGNVNPMDRRSYIVTRGALRLDFSLLFLRQPGPGEYDITIAIPELQLIASKVWGG